MWNLATIAFRQTISNAEFNEFCASHGAEALLRREDPPEVDLFTHYFLGKGRHPIHVSKSGNRDDKSPEHLAYYYKEETRILGTVPASFVHFEVRFEDLTIEEYLDFYNVAWLFLNRWTGVLDDFFDNLVEFEELDLLIEQFTPEYNPFEKRTN